MTAVRLAELLGALSMGCDLANGYPQGKVLRTAIVVSALGARHGLARETLRDAYYTTLLRFLGCTGFAHEEAHTYGAGDDISVRRTMGFADGADKLGLLRMVASGIAPEASWWAKTRAIARLVSDGSAVARHARAQCDASLALARIVGVSPAIERALGDVCERWDGNGEPDGDAGLALALPTRLFHVADVAELAHARHGRDGLRAVLTRRAGGQLDPALVAELLADCDAFAERLETGALWEAFLAAEPEPFTFADAGRVDDVARALGYFVDLKSVWLLGHSAGVAALCTTAATELGLPQDEVALLARAAHLHDIGRLAVPNAIWDHPGPLGAIERERVRLHSYTGERILWQCPALQPAARLAAAAHERLDGSGYHRGIPAAMVPRAARILAAADVVQAMGEPRAYRPALAPETIAREVRAEVAAGRLDAEAADAVLLARGLVGKRARLARSERHDGMSDRELEVLRLVARGKTNKEIGLLLGISARTVQHHVAHCYDKVGVYSRAGAALYVVERGLLEGDTP